MAKGRKTGGRVKGVPNHFSMDVKMMILQALEGAGGVEYLTAQAHENPKAFLSLLGRVLPLQVAGDPSNPLRIDAVVRRIVDASDGAGT